MHGDFTLRNTSVFDPPKRCDICLRPLPINETRGLCIVCRNAQQRRHENLFHTERKVAHMDNGWIDKETRPPTQEDADVHNCVLAYHLYQGVMVTGFHRVNDSSFFTHWQRTPVAPPEVLSIKAKREQAEKAYML